MVKIIVKEKNFEINRIISVGCSYTAGSEILEHLLSPYFVELKKKLNAFEWFEYIKKDQEQYNLLMELRKQEPNYAWPAKIASMLDIEFLNLSKPGNSNESAYWLLEKLFFEGKISNNDLVLVGLTSVFRSMFFSKSSDCPIPFLFSNVKSYKDQIGSKILNWFTDERIAWDHYKDLKGFESIKDQLGGRLFLVPMEKPLNEICSWPYNNRYGTLNIKTKENAYFLNNKICQLYNSDLFLTNQLFLYQFSTQETRLDHGHLNEKAHVNFAQLLVNQCIKTI